MTSYKLESSLLPIVSRFLLQHSYAIQVAEMPFFEHRIDLLGYSNLVGASLAIELKLSKWKRAFEQALIYQLCTDYSAVALPRRAAERAERAWFREYGVGLFAVDQQGEVEILMSPRRSASTWPRYRDELAAKLSTGEA